MVLAHRDFRLLWLGQLGSQFGTQFNCIALAWLVLVSTGSSAAMGGVFIAQMLPNPLFGWWAGVIVDRVDRRRLMIVTDLVRGALVLVIPVLHALGSLTLPVVYGVTFVTSALTLVFYASEKSVIPALLPESEWTAANAWAEMTSQAAGLGGPVLAGVLVAALPSPVHVLYLDALSFAWSAALLARMAWRDDRRPAAEEGSVLGQAREGLAFLLGSRFLAVVCLTATAVNFLLGPYSVVFPVLAERTLVAGPVGYGWLVGGLGGGMLLGSVAAEALSRRWSSRFIIYGGMVGVGFCFAGIAASPWLWLSVLLAALAGLGISPANAVIMTLVQQGTPARLQGRVFASMFALVGTAMPLGVAMASLVLDTAGPRAVLLAMGALTVLVAACMAMFLPRDEQRG